MMKTVPIDLKKLSDVVGKEAVKNTIFNKLNTKENNLEKKITDATTLIHINQHSTDKQNLEKEFPDVDKEIPDFSGLVTATVLNTKISETENKIPYTKTLVKKTDYSTTQVQGSENIGDLTGV